MKKANRLLNETSPYLLQHAYNPVQWYPWGEEAFNAAKNENKPIFLSIGYSTCHWCHVMERESFEDEEVAELLNKYFISIKVDKEERPDVDAVYMEVCQALTGSGGWPLSVFMTAEQKPFFAGTYFPKTPRYGQQGFLNLLSTIHQKWESEKDELLKVSESVTSQMRAFTQSVQGGSVDIAVVSNAQKYFEQSFDEEFGGFGQAPKFPQPHNLLFLLRCHHLEIGDKSLKMVEDTLQSMIRGGIFDHIGYGFSRYSTDRMWLAPHFEKMLYDNALLVMALSECWQVTSNEIYKYAAQKTLDYVKREMTSPEGAFFSAEDADSEGVEGKFYTFSRQEILSVLGKDDGEYFCEAYNISEKGNFEGSNIPNLISSAINFLMEPNLEMMREDLYEYRKNRYELHKDDKILTSWNALMITAYAKAYLAFDCEEYLSLAENAFDFIMKNMRNEKGGFYISHRKGVSKGEGLLDDYSFMIWAALSLYDASLDEEYLIHACKIAERVLQDFSSDDVGFFLSPVHGEKLLLRTKEQYDGAMPSGNSVMLYCLARLWHLTGDMLWRDNLDRQTAFYSDIFNKHPAACSFALCGLMQGGFPSDRLVCVEKAAERKKEITEKIFGNTYRPFAAVLSLTKENEERLSSVVLTAKNYKNAKEGFYLCRGEECLPVVDSLEKAVKLIDKEPEFA